LICITFIFIVRMVFVITFGGIDEQNNFVQWVKKNIILCCKSLDNNVLIQ
jgi:hypothetical protein